MYSKTITGLVILMFISCKNSNSQLQVKDVGTINKVYQQPDENPYSNIRTIPAPEGFKRVSNDVHSFSNWLQQVPLKKDKTVYLFDGTKKRNQSAQFAVIDMPVGNKNLQQCADAVMRLRASYLFDMRKYDSIVFFDNEGRAYRFTKPYTKEHFNTYLETVFGMCGTASLSKQLKKIDYKDIQPGDVLIRGGFPGHAVIVMDIVVNNEGKKKYMIAQSYMPAQNIHVLINPVDESHSPWYDITDADTIETPEYTFYSSELKRW